MKKEQSAQFLFILPFAVWMAMLFTLPSSAASYAARTAATAVTGIVCAIIYRRKFSAFHTAETGNLSTATSVIAGITVGAAVCAMWIAVPAWPFVEPSAPNPSPYAPETCGWALTLAKLAGSAFVIAPVEEYFFRSYLYRRLIARDFLSVPLSRFDLSAFLWTILIFTLEHDRPLAAALTGAAYGLLAIRMGIGSAIAAHVTTNLLLGLHVIFRNAWQFW
jgi:CAAX prenyl protease-like protein